MKDWTTIKQWSGIERRRNPDRRKSYGRRIDGFQMPAENNEILNTKEACSYLKISRPTYLKLINAGKIRAKKIGNAWKVFKFDLDRWIREG